jgi:lysyl-tRNA synthetase class 1
MPFWTDEIVTQVAPASQLINDSKTPSGRVHVGALRGVLIHDAIRRALQDACVPATFTFGVDDYDPLDELPAGLDEFYRPYLGRPLCDVPAPPGSNASDIAEHYISEFFAVFDDLEVKADTYRMRDVYRRGTFNAAIDQILRNAAVVREVYADVSKSQRPGYWLPFQVICPTCGRIGTTVTRDYDGETVAYECRADHVAWAEGCGASGRSSPFDGHGKLPWKLEWTAKWAVFGVTIEGAGKDHTVKGGSRDVAAACLRRIFDKEPPLNVPYEFFLVRGAKMSSSRGLGVSAREMADFLPRQVLRFLVIRTKPRSTVNFEPTEASVTRLFSDFDKARVEAQRDPEGSFAKIYHLTTSESPDYWAPPFPLVVALEQLPHVDTLERLAALKGDALTSEEVHHVEERRHAARYWLANFASDEERLVLFDDVPPAVEELTTGQLAFACDLAKVLESGPWLPDELQDAIFSTAKRNELDARTAFEAIYLAFFGRRSGPRAGALLSFLPREFVLTRLSSVCGSSNPS